MSPKYRRQNRNVCDLVLIFSQNQVLFFIEVQLYMSFESRPYSASHKTSSTRSFRNNIQWWEILPYSDKEITLKTFVKLRLQPQKKNSVNFTYRRRSTQKYYVCCVTRQYLFRIHFFASQRLSGGPAYLYNYIYLLLSSFFFTNTSFSKISVTLDQDYGPSITWQKERACNVLISEFPAPSLVIYIYSKQFSAV